MAFLMIFEQTNSYQIILPLMLVSIVSNAVSRRIKRESLHMESLKRRGLELPRGPEAGVMRTLRVSNVMHYEVQAVNQSDGFRTVVDAFLRQRINFLYVVDDTGRFVGAIPFHEMKEMLARSESVEAVIALDLVDTNFERVTPEYTLAETMDRFWKQNSERLPVVSSDRTGKLIGWISKRDLIGVYKQEILRDGRSMSRFGQSGDPEGKFDRFVELPLGFEVASLEVTPELARKTLRQLDMRSAYGLYILQITRDNPPQGVPRVEMPGPDSVLRVRDRVIVVGPSTSIDRFRTKPDRD
jgi:CBS domain-containing protein